MRRTTVIGVVLAITAMVAVTPAQAQQPSPANHGLVQVGPHVPARQQVDEDLAMAYHEAFLQAEQNPFDFGYPLLDRANQRLVVTAVTEAGLAKPAVTRAGVAGVARIGSRSFAELENIRSSLTRLEKEGVPDADAIYFIDRDEESNRVIVTVDRASDALFAEIAKRFGTQPVAIRIDPDRPALRQQSGGRESDRSPHYSGARIGRPAQLGGSCSTAFPWTFGGTYALLTAGHCVYNGGTVTSAGQEIGHVIASARENWNDGVGTVPLTGQSAYRGDLALVAITTNGSVDPRVYRGAPGSNTSAAIYDRWARRSMVLDQYCTGGVTTGELCGWQVEHVGTHVRYDSGNYVQNVNIGLKSGTCTDHGDSGGPVYTVRSDGTIAAKGVNSGSVLIGHPFTCGEVFTDIWDAYTAFPGDVLTMSTTVNGAGPAMLYRTGAASVQMFRWNSSNSSFPRATDWTSSGYAADLVGDRMVSGDFNGDGYDDIVTAYDYGSTFRFHMFLNGRTYTGDSGWYESGTFDVDRVGGRMVAGNWNGDSYDDIGMIYDAGNGETRAYLWHSTGSSFTYYTQSNFPGYPAANIGDRVAAGDVDGDGHDDIVVAYDLGGQFRYDVLTYGRNWPTTWYTSGGFTVANVGARFVVGDFDYNGYAEPAMFYDYGGGHARLFRWISNGFTFTSTTSYESATGYGLSLVGDRMAADDVNGDGADDIVTAYDYGENFRYHVFLNGYRYQGDSGWYTSGGFELDNISDRMVLGRW